MMGLNAQKLEDFYQDQLAKYRENKDLSKLKKNFADRIDEIHMNKEKAYDILEIDRNTRHLSFADLKKKYHKQALKYHPDKNGNTEKFQQINEAFHFIKEIGCDDDGDENNDENITSEKNKYTEILVSFLSSIVDGK